MRKRWLAPFCLLLGGVLAPPAFSAGTLTGKVTDLEGNPVAGIPLWAVTSFQQQWTKSAPPAALSGPDGSFTITGLPPGEVDLYACGKRYVHTSRTLWFLDEPVHLALAPAALVRGRVLGPDGAPVEGVTLLARRLPWFFRDPHSFPQPPWSPCPDDDWATWEEGGRFEAGPLEAGEYRLEAFADGLTMEPPVLQLSAGGEVEGVEIRLRSDGSRAGRLTDAEGSPIDMAYVTFDNGEDPPRTSLSMSGGSFRFASRGIHPVTFQVKAEGYEALERTVDLASEAEPVHLVAVRDKSWRTVRGRVAGPAGAPIEGADIHIPAIGTPARSAADGSFSLQLSVLKPRDLWVYRAGFATGWIELDPEDEPAKELQVRLVPGAVVTGRTRGLTDDDHNRDTWVALRGNGPRLEVPLRADHTFRFENVPPGTWELTVNAAYRSTVQSLVVKPQQTEVTVEVAFPQTVLASGRVLDGAGQPVAGAELSARQDSSLVARGATRRDGSFAMHLPEGDVRLEVSHPDFPERSLEISVDRQPVKDLVIRLEQEDPSAVEVEP